MAAANFEHGRAAEPGHRGDCGYRSSLHHVCPAGLLREIGVEPTGQRRFLLADGRRVYMDYGRAWVTIDGESEVTIVVFGEDNAPPLLGAYTLEGLALAVDPVEQRLVPTSLILY